MIGEAGQTLYTAMWIAWGIMMVIGTTLIFVAYYRRQQ